jgi:hypothetical protein
MPAPWVVTAAHDETKKKPPPATGRPRKLRPTATPEYRLRARQFQRSGRRREDLVVLFEHLGKYYDDVLVSFEYDKCAVAAIKALPSGAGYWDATFKVWRIHPGYADRLAADLWSLGYTVRSGGDRR